MLTAVTLCDVVMQNEGDLYNNKWGKVLHYYFSVCIFEIANMAIIKVFILLEQSTILVGQT